MTGLKVRDYAIRERIGSGGVGDVYRATDLMLDRHVAIKLLRPGLGKQAEVVERFRTEARTLAQLHHPNIATLYALQREGDTLAMIMELVEGKTLSSVLAQHGALSQAAAISIMLQALDGVGYAHQNDVVHRDLKPSNLMLGCDGQVKVMDFGIARCLGASRLTRAGHAVGTAQYMAPEQIRGQEADARADIYSLATVLYEMLTDHLPFDGESDYEILRAQVEDTPRSPRDFAPEIPGELESVVMRGLAKDPADRFASTADLRQALVGATAGLVLPAAEELRALCAPAGGDSGTARDPGSLQELFDPQARVEGPTDTLQSSDFLLWDTSERGAAPATLQLIDVVTELQGRRSGPTRQDPGAAHPSGASGASLAGQRHPARRAAEEGADRGTEVWELDDIVEPQPPAPSFVSRRRARPWWTVRAVAAAAIAFVAVTIGAPGPPQGTAPAHAGRSPRSLPGPPAAAAAQPNEEYPRATTDYAHAEHEPVVEADPRAVVSGSAPTVATAARHTGPDVPAAAADLDDLAAATTSAARPTAKGARESEPSETGRSDTRASAADGSQRSERRAATAAPPARTQTTSPPPPRPEIPRAKPRTETAQKPRRPRADDRADDSQRPRRFAEPAESDGTDGDGDDTAEWMLRR